ncbi:MAG: prepilin-type N-terminal cleavage/methylation domain-containing protein [Candidatus Ozemobacteraceae bacterium]
MNNNRRPGVSLVEILVAVAILAVVMLPIALAFSSGNRGIQMTTEEFTAHAAGMELMEQVMSAPCRILLPGVYKNAQISDGAVLGGSPLRLHVSPAPGLTRELTITEMKKGAIVRFKKVDVTISWTSKEGAARHSFTLKSLLANES